MSKGRVLAVVAVALVLFLSPVSWPGGGTAADEPRPAAEPDFTGKVLAIHTDTADKTWVVLEQVQTRSLGGRAFLVGKGVDDGRDTNPYRGRTLWIAVEHVVKMVEFASPDEYRRAYSGGQP